MKTYHLQFHPVWDKAMSADQKEYYDNLVSSLSIMENQLTTKTAIANYKENGGFVTTVLLNNGYLHSLNLDQVFVKVTNNENKLIAEGKFQPKLMIDAHCSQPWSFVFSKAMVKHNNSELINNINVEVIIDD